MNEENQGLLMRLAFIIQDRVADGDDLKSVESYVRTECEDADMDFESAFGNLEDFIKSTKAGNDNYERAKQDRHDFLRHHKDAAIAEFNVSSGLNLSVNEKELGIGKNGFAYKSSDNAVIKVSGDLSEFLFARLLMLKGATFEHFPKIHNAILFIDGVYVIHLELLETSIIKRVDFNRWKDEFYCSEFDWKSYITGSQLPQEIKPSQDALKCFDVFRKVWNITKEWGVEIDIEELRLNNLGARDDGTFVLYDQGIMLDDENLLDYVYKLCDEKDITRLELESDDWN